MKLKTKTENKFKNKIFLNLIRNYEKKIIKIVKEYLIKFIQII